jgi:MFS transporter, ACS family, glucarate transporter
MRRYAVVAGLFLLSLITYIDRACISTAKGPIAHDLNLSDQQMGMVFGAFALGYALFQIPGGWLADRIGPRLALAGVVSLWSVLTAITGMAWNFVSLVAIRFLFGAAEAGAFPGGARAFYNWLPARERGRANGVFMSGSRLGAALAFPLLVWLMTSTSWRVSFLILGGASVLWAVAWFALFRDHPKPPLPQEPSSPQAIHLGDVFRTVKFVPAMLQYFAGNFTFFLCLTWMNPYLKRQYGLSDATAATLSMIPLLVGVGAQWFTGFLVDRLWTSRWRAWSRRIPGILGFAISGASVLLVAEAPTAGWAIFFFTLATFGEEMTISPSWSYCADVAGKQSGSVSAAMNMVGNLGSFLSANAFPWLAAATGSSAAYFLVAAALNFSGVLCWWRMRSS